MNIDTKALDNAADTLSRSMRALNSMELAGLPPELDQDARDIARIIQEYGKRIIQEHGKDYADTAYDDMTAPLLESLARLVQAAKAADRIAALEAELATAKAEARELRERSAHVDRAATRLAVEKDTLAQELARVRELPAKWRAAPQNPDEPLLAIAADELDAALSHPAEQHDPLAVSDHCPECSEPEPECVCGEQPDEHGLPVVERTADMPEDVTHMTLHTCRFFRAGELRARSVEGDEGLLRIEDYRPAAQES